MSQKRTHPLKAYREKFTPPLSQRQAAKRFGVSQAQWSRWERGVGRPNPKMTKRLMRKTDAPLDVLMGIAS